MQVSVIIPVYNAEKYLRESVRSALEQPETAEVILVDDGSTDGSLALAHALAKENSKIIVSTHAGGINRGSAETRNAGIKIARFEYIAFIDADDHFLPGRFTLTKKIFSKHADADGVYEAVKNVYAENAISRSKTESLNSVPDLHIVHEIVAPELLLQLLIDDPVGIILLQGLCVKRSLFEKTGLFDPDFRVVEDMLLIKKWPPLGVYILVH